MISRCRAASDRIRRSLLLCLIPLAVALHIPTAAVARPPTYLPWTYGHAYNVIQGNHGGYSHATTYTRYGWDFGMPSGTPVLAAAPGQVAIASYGHNGGWGNTVVVCYGDGTCSRYAHLSWVGVGPGQSVGQAQHLGNVGSSGNSTGPHLHYQLESSSGVSLASSFVEAGVPGPGQWVTSQNRGGTYGSSVDGQFPMDGNGVVHIAQGDGAKVSLGFNLRNSGTRTWEDMRLALVNDPPHNMRRALGWQDLNHIPGDIQRVEPGQVAKVRFHVNPEEINPPGDYQFQFRLFDLGTREWIAGAEPSFVLRVHPACYTASPASQQVSPLVAPGERGQVEIALRNAGSCPWSRGEVKLGTLDDAPFPYADDSWSAAGTRLALAEDSVQPGEVGHFRGTFVPPATPASNRHKQYFAPVVEGKQWFSKHLGLFLNFFVGDADHLPFTADEYQASYVSHTEVGHAMAPGEQARVMLTLRNEGLAVLFDHGSRQVNLRGIREQDRRSGFVDPDDPRAINDQGVRLDQGRVDPGETFSFTLPVKVAKSVAPGYYREYFRPVAEGFTWFGREDMFWPFVVR